MSKKPTSFVDHTFHKSYPSKNQHPTYQVIEAIALYNHRQPQCQLRPNPDECLDGGQVGPFRLHHRPYPEHVTVQVPRQQKQHLQRHQQ